MYGDAVSLSNSDRQFSSIATSAQKSDQPLVNTNEYKQLQQSQEAQTNEMILSSISESKSGAATEDTVSVGINDLYKGLTVLGQEILQKLDQILAEDLPGGIASLDPAEHTPEKTADRIVTGVTALLPLYQSQNPDLEGEELINAFMEEVNKGIDEGYADAIEILEGIGAFKVEGVREGIEETMKLVDEKLGRFKEAYLEAYNKHAPETEESTESSLLTQAGVAVIAQENETAPAANQA